MQDTPTPLQCGTAVFLESQELSRKVKWRANGAIFADSQSVSGRFCRNGPLWRACCPGFTRISPLHLHIKHITEGIGHIGESRHALSRMLVFFHSLFIVFTRIFQQIHYNVICAGQFQLPVYIHRHLGRDTFMKVFTVIKNDGKIRQAQGTG